MTTQKKAEHTATPWEVHKNKRGIAIMHPLINKEGEYKGKLGGYHVVIQERQLSPEGIETTIDKADAAFIVLAVNNHERLVSSLRTLEGLLSYWMPRIKGQVKEAVLYEAELRKAREALTAAQEER